MRAHSRRASARFHPGKATETLCKWVFAGRTFVGNEETGTERRRGRMRERERERERAREEEERGGEGERRGRAEDTRQG